jgi:DNA-directed RNA polymerase sigma subunit (sigma70/sigma32)
MTSQTFTHLAKEREAIYQEARHIEANFRAEILTLHNQGMTLAEIASLAGISRQRVHQIVKEAENGNQS